MKPVQLTPEHPYLHRYSARSACYALPSARQES